MSSTEVQGAQVLTQDQWRDVLHRMVPTSKDDALRRRAPRHSVTAMLNARLVYDSDAGSAGECQVLLTEVADGGLTLRSRTRVREETLVRVQVRSGPLALELRGRVVHCTQTLAAYKIGIELNFPAGD